MSFPKKLSPQKNKTTQEILLNFHTNRLIEVAPKPQLVWELCCEPNNIFRHSRDFLKQILIELDRRILLGELDPSIKSRILEAIDQPKPNL